MNYRKFSLIELLIVIAIIAVLTAILLPVFNKARDSAKKINCSSNLRQLSFGYAQYLNDNHDYFPTDWIRHLEIYLPSYKTYVCPSGPKHERLPLIYFYDNINWPGHYANNDYALAHSNSGKAQIYFKANQCRNPGRTPMIFDCCYSPKASYGHLSTPATVPLVDFSVGRYVATATAYTPAANPYISSFGLWHERMGNIAYVDGSVRAISASELKKLCPTTTQAAYFLKGEK